ncbi:MAG: hypothetical protein F6J86_06660 [Symploca sp. SIO1B1]|nr:hypothetical protein [Symploca sp. SIO1B1]
MSKNPDVRILQIISVPAAIALNYVLLSKLCQQYIEPLPELFKLLSQITLLLLATKLSHPLIVAIGGISAEIPHLNTSAEVLQAIASWLGLWVAGFFGIPFFGYLVYFSLKNFGFHPILALIIGAASSYGAYQLFMQYLQEKRNYFLNLRK